MSDATFVQDAFPEWTRQPGRQLHTAVDRRRGPTPRTEMGGVNTFANQAVAPRGARSSPLDVSLLLTSPFPHGVGGAVKSAHVLLSRPLSVSQSTAHPLVTAPVALPSDNLLESAGRYAIAILAANSGRMVGWNGRYTPTYDRRDARDHASDGPRV